MAVPDARPARFLALGDSYTIGESVGLEDRWPAQLARRLAAEGVRVAEPEIIATTGWTTDELAAGIDQVRPQGPYDLVSLLIGVNNQFRGRDEEEYRVQFAELLQRAVALAANRPERVLVLSIPDWGVTPFARGRDRARIAAEIDRFNAINRAAAEEARVAYIDVTPVSRRAEQDAGLIAEDGLHPSARMYAEWAHLALPAGRAALQK